MTYAPRGLEVSATQTWVCQLWLSSDGTVIGVALDVGESMAASSIGIA